MKARVISILFLLLASVLMPTWPKCTNVSLLSAKLFCSSQPDSGDIIYGAMQTAAKKLEKKYGIYASSIGSGTSKTKEKLLTMGFHRDGSPILLPEARKFLHLYYSDFLYFLNQSNALQNLLGHPVEIYNVEFYIINYVENGKAAQDPYITIMSVYEGEVIFKINWEKEQPGYKSTITESYEESLKILQNDTQT